MKNFLKVLKWSVLSGIYFTICASAIFLTMFLFQEEQIFLGLLSLGLAFILVAFPFIYIFTD